MCLLFPGVEQRGYSLSSLKGGYMGDDRGNYSSIGDYIGFRV